jgi:hypothetical protein
MAKLIKIFDKLALHLLYDVRQKIQVKVLNNKQNYACMRFQKELSRENNHHFKMFICRMSTSEIESNLQVHVKNSWLVFVYIVIL